MADRVNFKLPFNGETHRFCSLLAGDELFLAVQTKVATIVKSDAFELFWNDEEGDVVLDSASDLLAAIDFAKVARKSAAKTPCVLLSLGEPAEAPEVVQQDAPVAAAAAQIKEEAPVVPDIELEWRRLEAEWKEEVARAVAESEKIAKKEAVEDVKEEAKEIDKAWIAAVKEELKAVVNEGAPDASCIGLTAVKKEEVVEETEEDDLSTADEASLTGGLTAVKKEVVAEETEEDDLSTADEASLTGSEEDSDEEETEDETDSDEEESDEESTDDSDDSEDDEDDDREEALLARELDVAAREVEVTKREEAVARKAAEIALKFEEYEEKIKAMQGRVEKIEKAEEKNDTITARLNEAEERLLKVEDKLDDEEIVIV